MAWRGCVGGLWALLGWIVAAPCGAAMPHVELFAGTARIDAEVAANEPDRELGLMRRTYLGPNEGMLFVFPTRMRPCMWMKDTLLPLSVAFLDEAGRILNIEQMAPQTEDAHCAARAAAFALEMNQGWFAAKGLKAGDPVKGLARFHTP